MSAVNLCSQLGQPEFVVETMTLPITIQRRSIMPLVIVAIGVVLLLLLMIRFKMNGFIALVLVALAVGLMRGMPLVKVISSIKAGVGGTLGKRR